MVNAFDADTQTSPYNDLREKFALLKQQTDSYYKSENATLRALEVKKLTLVTCGMSASDAETAINAANPGVREAAIAQIASRKAGYDALLLQSLQIRRQMWQIFGQTHPQYKNDVALIDAMLVKGSAALGKPNL